MVTNYRPGDVLILRKNHPCDKRAHRFLVVEIGAICRIRCLNCGHEMVMTRDRLNGSALRIWTDKESTELK